MKEELFKFNNRLGFMNPFYLKKNNHFIIEKSYELIMKEKKTPNYIDPVSIIEILNKSYTFGDRTFVEDVNLTPWMAKPNEDGTSWKYVDNLPSHGNLVVSEEEAAESLFEKLKKEIKDYIGNSTNVGILLSGGMDSRIIAAVIRNLQLSKEININVIAMTWGIDNCRDVIYSKKISDLFEWEWKHFKLSSENLIKNMEIVAKNGALYSPIHLHAMPEISEQDNIDCILAGSFGDSVGRAEYSGIKVKNLIPTDNRMFNKFKMIKSNVYKKYVGNVHKDLNKYHLQFPREEKYQYYELEKQLHYMRKELNQCMSVINQKIPLYQGFTSPEVFGYMWSLSPEIRNDKIYYHILDKYSSELLEIPWARTGCRYLSENSEKPDDYLKNFHNYGKWIKEDLYNIIKEKILSSQIKNLNIFNVSILERLLKENSFLGEKITMIDEYLIWIATLADFVKIYDVKGLNLKKCLLIDSFDSILMSRLQYFAYKSKHLLKT